MASLEELSDVAEEEGSAVPEATGLFDNFVTSDSQIVFDYQVGFISFGSRPKVSIIGVCEVDQQALVAVPDLAWHRQKARRHMPDDALQKAVRVEARVGSGLDRTVPEDGTGIKIWLGFLKADYVDLVAYGLDALPDDILFPSDTVGLPMLPHAEALVAISHDHFVFLSAESGGAKPVYGTPDVETRLGQLEGTMAEILENLKQLKPGAASSRPSALHGDHGPRKPDPPRVSFAPPCGLDPHVVQQALMAGVSKKSFRRSGPFVAAAKSDDSRRSATGRRQSLGQRQRRGGRASGRRFWQSRSYESGSGQPEQDRQRDAERKEAEEGSRPRVHSGSRRIWLSKGFRGLYKKQGGCSPIVAQTTAHRPEAHLSGGRRPHAGGLGDGRSTTSRSYDHSDLCPGLVGASLQNQLLPRDHSTCLALCRHLGLPHARSCRRSQSEGGPGHSLLRPTSVRQRGMASGIRDDLRAPAAL